MHEDDGPHEERCRPRLCPEPHGSRKQDAHTVSLPARSQTSSGTPRSSLRRACRPQPLPSCAPAASHARTRPLLQNSKKRGSASWKQWPPFATVNSRCHTDSRPRHTHTNTQTHTHIHTHTHTHARAWLNIRKNLLSVVRAVQDAPFCPNARPSLALRGHTCPLVPEYESLPEMITFSDPISLVPRAIVVHAPDSRDSANASADIPPTNAMRNAGPTLSGRFLRPNAGPSLAGWGHSWPSLADKEIVHEPLAISNLLSSVPGAFVIHASDSRDNADAIAELQPTLKS